MSEKRRAKRRKDEYQGPGEQQVAEKPTKESIKVAKWMKKNIRCKKTKLLNHNVEYFTANKAIDSLLKSKFAQNDDAYFTTREEVVEFLDTMLSYKFFHRALKVPVAIEPTSSTANGSSKASKRDKEKKDDQITSSKEKGKLNANSTTSSSLHRRKTAAVNNKEKEEKEKEKLKERDNEKDKKENDKEQGSERMEQVNNNNAASGIEKEGSEGDALTTAAPTTIKSTPPTGDTQQQPQAHQKKEKRKRKIRLDMHPEQVFVDGSDAYVWIYDPIPVRYWFYGMVLLLSAIGVCLFPLWPPVMRKGVYYLSQAAAGFFITILVLTLLRLIIFTLIWAVTAGRLHFWMLPNLTEDVGFFASFWPLYESKYCSDDENSSKSSSSATSKRVSNGNSSKKLKKKAKDSDAEENEIEELCGDGEEEPASLLEAEKIAEIKEHDADLELKLSEATKSMELNGGAERKGSIDGAHQTETEEERGNTSGNSSAAEAVAGDSDAKRSQTPSESESDGKDYEIISTKEVQSI